MHLIRDGGGGWSWRFCTQVLTFGVFFQILLRILYDNDEYMIFYALPNSEDKTWFV